MTTERQARLQRALPEAAAACLRAQGVATEARIAEAVALLAPVHASAAAELAAIAPEVDGMDDAALVGWLIDYMRPVLVEVLGRQPS